MRIGVALLPDTAQGRMLREDATAVVVDVLRATTVMAVAADAGADQIMTCREVDQALAVAASLPSPPLLVGERDCRRIEGFDLGNSPSEYTSPIVAGRTLVMTTTNGTRALAAAEPFPTIAVAAFVNLASVVDWLAGRSAVQVICAGTEGRVSAEDALLAGALVDRCEQRYGAEPDSDEAILVRDAWRLHCGAGATAPVPKRLAQLLADSLGGRNLLRKGYGDDLLRCAAVDSVDLVVGVTQRTPMTLRALSFGPPPGLSRWSRV